MKFFKNIKKKIILNFLYWRESEIHPCDANNLVEKYFKESKNKVYEDKNN